MTVTRFKLKNDPGFRQRILRSYRRVADRDYTCDNCMFDIMPGDMYDGVVCVNEYESLAVAQSYLPRLTRKTKLYIRRYHAFPCNFDPDDEDERRRDEESESDDVADVA